jgi:hypothetical protein
MSEFFKKYYWIILIIVALFVGFIFRGVFIKNPTKDDYEKWKIEKEALQKQHIDDSIKFEKIMSYWKEKTYNDSIKIINSETNYKKIKWLFDNERKKTYVLPALGTLQYFTDWTDSIKQNNK